MLTVMPDREIPATSRAAEPTPAKDHKSGIRPGILEDIRLKKVWIDLDNSPHIPFFKPIIEELERRGCTIVLTARDCFQVRELADLFGLQYHLIGRHYGKLTIAKIAGLTARALQMAPLALREKPDLAVSHGSRSLFVLCSLLRIPTITITDYEHASWGGAGRHSWIMAPEVVPEGALLTKGYKKDHILRYPGIKEDVYAPAFQPDPASRQRLGLGNQDLVVTVRPPASEAHYRNPESDKLMAAVFEIVSARPEVRVVLLPRTSHQEDELRKQWPELFGTGRISVPARAVDGLELIWCSDLVISGGGTMNREAAALGVPVYSTFRGKTGAVDEYLAHSGRLVLLQSVEDVKNKIKWMRRNIDSQPETGGRSALRTIVDHITRVLGTLPQSPGQTTNS